MKIIIVGLGQTGTLLARRIAAEGHDTVVIDCDKERVEAVTNLYNVSGVCGSGASKEILLQAGAATADVVITVSPIDEINMMACMVAKNAAPDTPWPGFTDPNCQETGTILRRLFRLIILPIPSWIRRWRCTGRSECPER